MFFFGLQRSEESGIQSFHKPLWFFLHSIFPPENSKRCQYHRNLANSLRLKNTNKLAAGWPLVGKEGKFHPHEKPCKASSSWWFQPLSKILVKIGIFPNFRGENNKYLKPPAPKVFSQNISKCLLYSLRFGPVESERNVGLFQLLFHLRQFLALVGHWYRSCKMWTWTTLEALKNEGRFGERNWTKVGWYNMWYMYT